MTDPLGHAGRVFLHPALKLWLEQSAGFHTDSSAVIALSAAGFTEPALELAENELAHSRALGAPVAVACSTRALGLVVDDSEASVVLLKQAAALLAPTGARLEHARTLIDLDAAVRRPRQSATGPARRS